MHTVIFVLWILKDFDIYQASIQYPYPQILYYVLISLISNVSEINLKCFTFSLGLKCFTCNIQNETSTQ